MKPCLKCRDKGSGLCLYCSCEYCEEAKCAGCPQLLVDVHFHPCLNIAKREPSKLAKKVQERVKLYTKEGTLKSSSLRFYLETYDFGEAYPSMATIADVVMKWLRLNLLKERAEHGRQ